MKKDIFYIDINDNDETGLDAISLVSHPAVECDFLCFDEDVRKIDFSADDEKRIITGIALRADHPIYRINNGFEYYVVFTKDVIRKLVNKYAKNGLFNSVNIEHNEYSFVKSAYMVESFIVDKNRGIVPKEFSDIEDGSWVVSYYINDDQLWDAVKNTNALNGFSVQGLFKIVEGQDFDSQKEQTFEEWLDECMDSI